MVTECSATTPSLANDTGSVPYVARARSMVTSTLTRLKTGSVVLWSLGARLWRGEQQSGRRHAPSQSDPLEKREGAQSGSCCWRRTTAHRAAAVRVPPRCCTYTSALLREVTCRPYWTCTAGAAGRAPSALLYVHCCAAGRALPALLYGHCCAAGRALLRCCTCTAALLYVHCCADVRVPLRCCTCTVGAAVGVV